MEPLSNGETTIWLPGPAIDVDDVKRTKAVSCSESLPRRKREFALTAKVPKIVIQDCMKARHSIS